jgi:hypothetical protein
MFFDKNTSRSLLKDIDFTTIIIVIVVTITISIVSYYNTRDIQLKIAYKGWGPQDYVAQKMKPENFKRNWPSGIMNYDLSLLMRVYYYLAKYLDISPTITVYPYMVIQIFLFTLSITIISKTLFRDNVVIFLCVVVILNSYLPGLDLARFATRGFGGYLSYPVFYGYAVAFSIFGITYFIRKDYTLCFVFVALSIYSHLAIGLFTLMFIAAYIIYAPRLFMNKYFLGRLILFLMIVAPLIWLVLFDGHHSVSTVPVEKWLKSMKLFSFHWFPLTMKLFTINAGREFFPTLIVIVLLFIALRYQSLNDERLKKIVAGLAMCSAATICGVIFSDVIPIPALIKLSMQRSSGLITFFGILFFVNYLWEKIERGQVLSSFVAMYALLALFFSLPANSLLFPILILLYSDIKEGHAGWLRLSGNWFKIACGACLLVFVMLGFLGWASSGMGYLGGNRLLVIGRKASELIWEPILYFNPFYGLKVHNDGIAIDSFVAGLLVSAGLCGVFFVIGDRRVKLRSYIGIIFLSIIALGSVYHVHRSEYLRWHVRNARIAMDYLEVQMWAKKKTAVDALFMTDPLIHYGWRDFSERSSFGNYREWGYSTIVYRSNYESYREGLQRIREFGVELEKIELDDIKKNKSFPYSTKFRGTIRRSYYKMNASALENMCEKYGIDYVVMKRRMIASTHKLKLLKRFKIVYQNNNFIVLYMKKKSTNNDLVNQTSDQFKVKLLKECV